MQIISDSELMENRKQATVLSPDRVFEVLQTQDGDAIFFSIGTDGVFYVTRELSQTATGWNRTDLSTSLAAQHRGATVTAKSFAVGQNVSTRAVDMALVITVAGQDFLYLSLGNGTTDAGWASPVDWTAVPFDAGTAPSPLTIADVYLANIGGTETIFADVIRTPGDPLQLLNRYYLTPGGTPQWHPHQLSVDLAADSIASCLGQPTGQPLSGIYTFGAIGGTQELIFTPQYNYFEPTAPPSPARLTLPAGATAIASATSAAGTSNLFVAATGGLYVFVPGDQHDQSAPAQAVAGGAFADATALAAVTDGGRTAVWGINLQRQLCYAACAAGSEGDPSAWSPALLLLPVAEQFAFFLNLSAGSSDLFVAVSGTELIRLTQDPVTSGWTQQSILLPTTAPGDVVVMDTYTTHIQVTDGNQVPVPGAALELTATSPASVYLNDVYYQLSPTVAVQVAADETGVLTVVQPTTTIAGTCFQVTATDTPAVTVAVNPMSKAQTTLASIKAGDNLAAVQIPNADGTTEPLVPGTVSASDRDAAASALAQLATISAGLPSNGSRQQPAAGTTTAAQPAAGTSTPHGWSLSFTSGGLAYHEGSEGASAPEITGPEDIGSAIEIGSGDLFQWLSQQGDVLSSVTVQKIQGIYQWGVTVGGQRYQTALDSYDAVASAAEWLLSQIDVTFNELVQWLGYIFQWADIVTTHQVLKNIFRQYAANCLATVSGSRTQVAQSFTSLQGFLGQWTGIRANIPESLLSATVAGTTGSATLPPGTGSPQANFGLQQLKSNAASGTMGTYSATLTSDMLAALTVFETAVTQEEQVIQAAVSSFQTNVSSKYSSLTVAQVIDGSMAILTDALLQSAENVVLAAIDFMVVVGDTFLGILDATIDIPVISALYQEIADDDLTVLDAICLVLAIPATICAKLVNDAAPFPSGNATTTALINAPNWAAIQQVLNPAPATSAAASAPRATAPRADISDQAGNALALVSGIVAFCGANMQTAVMALSYPEPDVPVLPLAGAVSYLGYVMPSFIGDISDVQDAQWYAVFDEVLAAVTTIKAILDAGMAVMQPSWAPGSPPTQLSQSYQTYQTVSAWVTCAANFIWLAPTIGPICYSPGPGQYTNTINILNLVGGLGFDLNGMLAPALAMSTKEPEAWAIFASVAAGGNLTYGALSAAAGILAILN